MKDDDKKAEGINITDLTEDQVKDLLEKNEYARRYIQREIDTKVSKGINTWKEETLPGVVKSELEKINPKETAEQRELREIKERMAVLEGEKKRSDLTNIALKRLTAEKLPDEFLDMINLKDEETVNNQIEKLKTAFVDKIQTAVEEQVAAKTGRKPVENNKDTSSPLNYNPYDKATWNFTKQLQLEQKQADLAKELKESAK